MAKMTLRGVNFSCSLIVLSMLSATFTIFNASKGLPPRGGSPAWAPKQKTWPQITLLSIACVSLAMSVAIIYAYWKGGHRRAEKAAVYYTVFAIGFFIFSIVMWAIGAAILNQSHKNGNDKDMWGWSCKDGKRKTLFEQDVDYALICRLQVSSLILDAANLRCANLSSELVTHLRFHRDYRRSNYHRHLWNSLLPVLLKAQATQIDGPPRPRTL